jgi:hypothetical protein
MRSISETLDFGAGLSLVEYDTRVQALQGKLSAYNTMLSALDEMSGTIDEMEQELRGFSEKMLMSVAARYGKDSLQYMQAGGTQRKRNQPSAAKSGSSETSVTSSVETAETNGKGTKTSAN